MTVSVSNRSDDYSTSFAKILGSVKNSRGVALSDFVSTLRPKYSVVYRDIALGYAAIAGTMVAAVLTELWTETWGVGWWLIAPLTALSVGYWIAYLLLFIHEGAHWNLAERASSDRVCNRLISWWAGLEVSRYRRIHFQHHRSLGTTQDSELSYFFPLNWVFVAKGLLGIRVIEVLLTRDAIARKQAARQQSGRQQAQKQQVNKNGAGDAAAAGGHLVHREMLLGALFHATCLGTLAWFGLWACAAGWALGVGAIFPFFGALRQVLEHRSQDARADVDYRETDHGAVTRLFGDGLVANTMGGAGFNRHLLHHWIPTVSYTRLPELEAFLLDTELADIIRARQTTYGQTFLALLRPQRQPAPRARQEGSV